MLCDGAAVCALEVKAAEVAPVAEKAIRCPDAKLMWTLNPH
eukprot:COSAG06_NODE_49870_length_322_cov_1.161435_1_plen_40_part_01